MLFVRAKIPDRCEAAKEYASFQAALKNQIVKEKCLISDLGRIFFRATRKNKTKRLSGNSG